MNKQYLLFLICLIAINSSVYAGKSELQKLEKRCEDARQKKIAPLREEAIKECAEKDKATRDARERCERFYVDYGSGVRYVKGGRQERMFNDLPECLKFYEAEKKYKAKSQR